MLDLWGEAALEQVGKRLPDDVRDATVSVAPMSVDWFPETYVIAWYTASWNGPCGGSKPEFFKLIDRMLDLGFGRVQRVALAFATPAVIVDRAPKLWRHDHSEGELTVDATDEGATVTLSDHPYTQDPLSCMATAEIYRYCLSLGRAKNVVAHHYRQPSGDLVVKLAWDR